MWNKVALDQLGYVSRGRSRHRPRNDSSLYLGLYPFVQTAEVKAADFWITKHSQTYNDKGLEQSRLWPKNTLCITIAANIADTALLSYPACFPDSIIGFIADEDKCDVRFIKYYFNIVQEEMRAASHGTTQDNLSQDKLLRFPISCPPLKIQRAIANTLANYDDLIENNRRRIFLLEESARLLYREWFVHLRFPNHETTKIKDGVPNGWEIRPLAKIAIVNKASLSNKNVPEEIQYLDISAVAKGSILGASKMPYAEAPGRARRLVQHGDVIWSCVRPNRCSYALLWEPDQNMVVSTGFAVLTAVNIPFSYLYFATSSEDFVAYLTNRATGAAYPAVTATDFEEALLLCPSLDILQKFHAACLSRLEARDNLIRQNAYLTVARDALLPKLMTGKIKV